MNISFKHLSLIITLSSLFASANTHCMRVKKLIKNINAYAKHYSSKTDDPLTRFCEFPSTKKISKKVAHKMPKKVLLHLVEQSKEIEQAQALQNAIAKPTKFNLQIDDNIDDYTEEDPYLTGKLSFKSQEEAAQALTSEYDHTRGSALYFFMKRIKKKKNLALIADIAKQTFTAPEKPLTLGHTREAALQIFTALVKEGHIPNTTLQIAATGMLTARGWGHVSWAARNLFEALFQKDYPQSFKVATQTAINAFLHEDWRTRDDGLQLFKILFKYGKGFKEATHIATHVVNNKSDWQEKLRNTFLLLCDLVNKNQDYEQGYVVATNIAMRFYMNEYHDVQKSAVWLLMNLVKKNRAIEQAIHVVGMKSGDTSMSKNMSKLINELKLLCLEKTPQKKLKWGPLEDLDFTPATDLDFPPKKAEPWSSYESVEEISVEQALYGITELGKRHKAFIETYDTKHKQAWKELDIDVCSKDIPICRASDGDFDDPKYTMLPGEEIKFTKAMCQLMRNNRTQFEEQGHRANDEKTNISPLPCTSKALMCITDPEKPQKKKRLLKDELKYPHGQEMGGDELKYSVTAKEFAAGLEEFEKQHRANVDRCGKE